MAIKSTRPPFTRRQRRWSRAVWAAVGAGCLAVEVTGDMQGTPWRTLSETTWDLEQEHPVLTPAIAGALLGLAVHLHSKVTIWRAEAGGVAIAMVAKAAWGE